MHYAVVHFMLSSDPGGALTTGTPWGDVTSYTVGILIAGAAWRLFKWYRAEQTQADVDQHDTSEKYHRNQLILLAYITRLSVLLAREGVEVPDLPNLEM